MDREAPVHEKMELTLLRGLVATPVHLRDISGILLPEHFGRAVYGHLYALLLDMEAKQEPIDIASVPERAVRTGKIEQYGGVDVVTSITEDAQVPASNLEYHARRIREHAVLRQFIASTTELLDRAYGQTEPSAKIIEDALARVMSLVGGNTETSWEQISQIIDREVSALQTLAENPVHTVGIPTGFQDLDKILAGLHRGDLVILAARPSMGKTALALNIAQNAALLGEATVGIFSLEMGREQLVKRMLSTHGQINGERMRLGTLTDREWRQLEQADRDLRAASIHIDDTGGLSLAQVRTRARNLAAAAERLGRPLGLLVIDYLQLMQSDDPTQPRQQQVSDISRGLKALARDLKVPVLALSQLSRAVESRADKRPLLSDLRESGAIEQDADVIMFIYRDEYYTKEACEKPGIAEVIVAKQRNGAVGTVDLVYQKEFVRFDDLVSGDGTEV